jgi:hypothetical protein
MEVVVATCLLLNRDVEREGEATHSSREGGHRIRPSLEFEAPRLARSASSPSNTSEVGGRRRLRTIPRGEPTFRGYEQIFVHDGGKNR